MVTISSYRLKFALAQLFDHLIYRKETVGVLIFFAAKVRLHIRTLLLIGCSQACPVVPRLANTFQGVTLLGVKVVWPH